MSASKVHGAVRAKAAPVTTQFQFGPWTLTAVKSHILESNGPVREKFENQLELPNFPEMIFADSVLRIEHSGGFGLEFNALDALKCVDAHNDLLKVSMSQVWQESRLAESEHMTIVKPFDWTFTTAYKGTLLGNNPMKVELTDDRIDMEKLKVREKIHFYEDIVLFEDELSDNGASIMHVKIRVMPTSFFILLRQFMRVDNVIVRVMDTRLHHEAEKNYILREHSCKDSRTEDIKAPPSIVTNPNEVAQLLPIRNEVFEKLVFPQTNSGDGEAVR